MLVRALVAEFLDDFRTPVPYAVGGITALVVGLAGPFGTYDLMPLGARLLFWAVLVAGAVAVGGVINAAVRVGLGLRSFRQGAVLRALGVAVICGPVLMLAIHAVAGDQTIHAPHLLELMLFVFSVTLATSAFRQALRDGMGHARRPAPGPGPVPVTVAADLVPPPDAAAEVGPGPEVPPSVTPRLLHRLEPGLRGDLVSITVRNHYVDVVTSQGQASLLMRFSDAMAEAEGVDGAQIHRSHWVAFRAISGVEKAPGGKMFVVLGGGMRLPVSSPHRGKLAARGLI